MLVGAPPKYKPEYCEALIEHMAQGFPYETFAATIDVCRRTLYNWEKEHKEFLHAKRLGAEKTYLALYSKGLDSLHDPGTLNNTVWAMMMKNMCGWRDKVEHETKNLGAVSVKIVNGDE